MEVVASLSQGRTAAAQCGLFTYKSVPVIFEPPCNISLSLLIDMNHDNMFWLKTAIIKLVKTFIIPNTSCSLRIIHT